MRAQLAAEGHVRLIEALTTGNIPSHADAFHQGRSWTWEIDSPPTAGRPVYAVTLISIRSWGTRERSPVVYWGLLFATARPGSVDPAFGTTYTV